MSQLSSTSSVVKWLECVTTDQKAVGLIWWKSIISCLRFWNIGRLKHKVPTSSGSLFISSYQEKVNLKLSLTKNSKTSWEVLTTKQVCPKQWWTSVIWLKHWLLFAPEQVLPLTPQRLHWRLSMWHWPIFSCNMTTK